MSVTLSVVVVGHGDEPMLPACLRALTRQLGVGDELILVDHGIHRVPQMANVRVVTPSSNSGFGGGCASGASESSGDVLIFVNSDAIVHDGALSSLRQAVQDPSVGLAGGLVVLADRPDRLDSAGLPVHLTGLSWCEGHGESVESYLASQRVTAIAGALFACRREVWNLLGGMDESYFLYHEDTDLSLRCHLAGLAVTLTSEAVATHHHEFHRNARKMFFLERNRFLTVLGDFPPHLLMRVLPVLVLMEPLYLAIAIRDGWWRDKLRAWGWLVANADALVSRRRRVQAAVTDRYALDGLLLPAVTQTQLDPPKALAAVNRAMTLYWRVAHPRSAGR